MVKSKQDENDFVGKFEELLINVPEMKRVRGVVNLGTTCYMSSALQCLSKTPYLRNVLNNSKGNARKFQINLIDQQKKIEGDIPVSCDPVTINLLQSIDNLNDNNSSISNHFDPSELYESVSKVVKKYDNTRAQNALQFLNYLIQLIDDEDLRRIETSVDSCLKNEAVDLASEIKLRIRNVLHAQTTTAKSIFEGILVSEQKCRVCNFKARKEEKFSYLSVGQHVHQTGPVLEKTKKSTKKLPKKNKRLLLPERDTEGIDEDGVRRRRPSNVNEWSDLKRQCPVSLQPNECSLETGLFKLTETNRLQACDRYKCDKCTENHGQSTYQLCDKRTLISKPPPVLIISFQKYEDLSTPLRMSYKKKLNYAAEFDLSPFCCEPASKNGTMNQNYRYSLYGVIEHSGGLTAGHFTSFVKVRPLRSQLDRLKESHSECVQVTDNVSVQLLPSSNSCTDMSASTTGDAIWFRFNDTQLEPVTENAALSAAANLLFYERSDSF